eukprot:evm.model.NODE_18839_length_45268_cov_23.220222.2
MPKNELPLNTRNTPRQKQMDALNFSFANKRRMIRPGPKYKGNPKIMHKLPNLNRFRSKKSEIPMAVNTKLAPSKAKPSRLSDGGIGSLIRLPKLVGPPPLVGPPRADDEARPGTRERLREEVEEGGGGRG